VKEEMAMMNYAVTNVETIPRYTRTPWAAYDVRTNVVKNTFVTEELAIEHAVFCQKVEEETIRHRAALDHVFGKGHTL